MKYIIDSFKSQSKLQNRPFDPNDLLK